MRKPTRINGFWIFILGFFILLGSSALYSEILQSVGGTMSVTDIYLSGRRPPPVQPVAILDSRFTRQAHLALEPRATDVAWADAALSSWIDFLEANNIRFEVIGDQTLEAGIDPTLFGALILPSTRAMSDRQILSVRDFLELGGSVLATWTPGVYRPDGSWRGWTFIEETFGVEVVRTVDPLSGAYQITQATFPGEAVPGLYRPLRDGEIVSGLQRSPYQIQMQRLADEVNFAPTTGYIWVDTLGAPPLQGDYLEARVMQQDAAQPSTHLTYYTWTRAARRVSATLVPPLPANTERFTLRANTPLTASVPGSYGVLFHLYNQGVHLRVTEPETESAGFWHDFTVADVASDESPASTSGLVLGTYGQGRFVYLGVQRDAVGLGVTDPEEDHVLGQVFINMMNYLLRKPTGWIESWPQGHTAAATLIGMAEHNPDHFNRTVALLAERGHRATYFFPFSTAPQHQSLIQTLRTQGEIGMIDSLHIATRRSPAVQADLLESRRQQFEQTVGGPISGYRPAYPGPLTETTLRALVRAGYRYALPDWVGPHQPFQVYPPSNPVFAGLNKTALQDREALAIQLQEFGQQHLTLMEEDLNRVHHEGGVYRLLFSSDLLGRPEREADLRSIVEELEHQDFWIAPAGEVARWWQSRQNIQLDVLQRGLNRLMIRIANTGSTPVEDLGIRIDLGDRVAGVDLRPDLARTPRPSQTLSEDRTLLRLGIDALKAGERRTYHIDMLREAPPGVPPTLTSQAN